VTPHVRTLVALVVAVACTVLAAFAAPAGAAAGWSEAVKLNEPLAANLPQVAVDAQGDAVATWLRSNGSTDVVEAALRPAGGSWQAPVVVADAGGFGIPYVAVDSEGDAVAVWERDNGAGGVVEAATLPVGGSWQAPVVVSAAGHRGSQPRVAVDAQGDAVVVWDGGSGFPTEVEAASRPAGGSWQAPVVISTADSTWARVAIDSQGDAVAVWERSAGNNNSVTEAASRPAGGFWQAPVVISPGYGENPGVAIDSQGDAVAVWATANLEVLEAGLRPAGGSWQAPAVVSDAGGFANTPDVAIGARGEAIAVWENDKGNHDVIEAATLPVGGSWQAPFVLGAGGGFARLPQVAVDSQGDAVAVWEDGTGVVVEAASRPAGGYWQPPIVLSRTGVAAYEPQVALGAQGDAVAVWESTGDKGASWSVESASANRPTVTSVSPNAGLESGDTSVTITGSELAGITTVMFGATEATHFEATSQTSITATSPAEPAGTVHITVANVGGTSAQSSADQFTYVAPGPAPTVTKLSAKKGPAAGGSSVTITGTSFAGVTAVKFGLINAASYEVHSLTSITAVSPAETTGAVEVHVTTPNGESGITSKDHFAYEAPTVTTVSPNIGSKLGDSSVTVTGSGFAPGSGTTTFDFGKGIATAVDCASTIQCTMLSPAAAKTGTVDVSAKAGGKTSKKNPPGDQYIYN
jgi:IPT/TIG domain